MTDPPVIADIALLVARRFGAPLVVVSQDVFPEIAVELKRLENPVVVSVLRAAIALLPRARRPGRRDRRDDARAGSRRRARGPSTMRVIPNWVDTGTLRARSRASTPGARSTGLADRFVVMHSGNVGHAQNLDALVRAATFLRDLDDLTVAIVGTGARHDALVELAELLEVEDTVSFWPYQPRELLSQSLSSADVHVVGLARGLSGYVVPSRLYGILSVGRPVIVAADPESETAQLVEQVGCGVVVPPGRPELLAEAIRAAHDGELDLAAMGARGREYVAANADRSVAVGRYRDLLQELVGAEA